jgi:uncharacterized membrane protein YsdA (DUF1294 family)
VRNGRIKARPAALPLVLGAALLVLVASAVWAGRLPAAVLWLYLVASAAAFVAYARDKSAARNGRWRVQERTLHLLALVGGWPGAVAAQRFLRHKSKKPSFQAVFWTTVVLNSAALGWLVSLGGQSAQ